MIKGIFIFKCLKGRTNNYRLNNKYNKLSSQKKADISFVALLFEKLLSYSFPLFYFRSVIVID